MGLWDKLSQRLTELVDDFTAPEQVREEQQRGTLLLQQGNLAEAEAHLQKLVTQLPTSGRAWHLLGLSQLRQGRIAAAQRSLLQARELRPDEFAVLVALGEAQRAAGEPAAALQTYKQALSLRADETLLSQVFAGLGEIFLSRGENERAVRELRKAVAAAEKQDLRLLGRLGEAQARAGELELACTNLALAATAASPERALLLRLSEVKLRLGQPEEARLAALRLLQDQPDDDGGRCALARSLLALGQIDQARQELLQALALQPRSVEVQRLLGEVYCAAGDNATALRHLRFALELVDEQTARLAPATLAAADDQQAALPAAAVRATQENPSDTRPAGLTSAASADAPGPAAAEVVALLRQMLSLQLEQDAAPQLEQDAARLLALRPTDPLALAALGHARADRLDEAQELAARALAAAETAPGLMLRGELLLAQGDPQSAASVFRAALRHAPSSARAKALLGRAYRRQGPLAEDLTAAGDLYPLLGRVRELMASHPVTADLATDVARIQQLFDRPLLVTVMGEFNSGKSTFVNALIGEKIAPMGITPTTATINILKYGERRGARVVWRDDREQRLPWTQVGPFLASLDHQQATSIRLVELLYPAEELLRVNVVDTPGLNSMIEEHEQTARAYLAEADAVIWLFSALQAGSETQQQALELIRQHQLKTVGVINKQDLLSAEELAQLERHLRERFSGAAEAMLAVSASLALDALVSGDTAQLEQNRFPALRALLEQELFERSRSIKRATGEHRLQDLLGQAEQRMSRELERTEQTLAALDQLSRQVPTVLPVALLDEERARLAREQRTVFRQGAGEVLDFVRPRRWFFGEHQATAADRDFLLEMLQEGTRRLGEDSFARLAGSLRRQIAGLLDQLQQALAPAVLVAAQGAAAAPAEAGGTSQRAPRLAELDPEPLGQAVNRLVEQQLALLRQQVYTRYAAFARGFLLGGGVDRFFERLPRLELTEESIYEALLEQQLDLEPELLGPLARWRQELLAALSLRITRLRQDVELQRVELDQRLLSPVLALRRALVPSSAARNES